VNYLVDTHVLVWWLTGDARLEASKRHHLNAEVRASTQVGLSDFSLWEIAMLASRGRLRTTGSIDAFLRDLTLHPGIQVIAIDDRIAADSVTLPESFPRDPADRIIAASARTRGLTLVTQDDAILRSGVVATL
jgi:PIN domain nuclease of toxin-antitoxin system